MDEPEQCSGHSDRWVEHAAKQLESLEVVVPSLHRDFQDSLAELALPRLDLHQLVEENAPGTNLGTRPLPVTPHQFGKLAEILRGKREVSPDFTIEKFPTWLISAQPSRSVALLQEHDCPAQFVPNPRDYPAIERLTEQRVPVAVKYSGLADLEGFILPSFRITVVTDREFFGQHVLASTGYVRKRRRASSKQVDLNKLRPGDYVIHKNHGLGKFLRLESLETREYLVVKYADGLLRVPADALELLSRYRHSADKPPQLNKMTGKTWENTKKRVRKAVQKIAIDSRWVVCQTGRIAGVFFPHRYTLASRTRRFVPLSAHPRPTQSHCRSQARSRRRSPHGSPGVRGCRLWQNRSCPAGYFQGCHGRQTGGILSPDDDSEPTALPHIKRALCTLSTGIRLTQPVPDHERAQRNSQTPQYRRARHRRWHAPALEQNCEV